MSAVPMPDVFAHSEVEILRAARDVVLHEARALQDVARRLDARVCAAVDLLAGCRGAVIVTGVGKAGLIGQKIAATMMSTGARALFLHPTEALHGDLGCVSADDVLLVLSNSGETEEVLRMLPWFRARGIDSIAITASDQSSLGSQATVAIPLGRLTEAGVHGLAPSTSTTAMLAVGDALAFVLSRRKQFSPQQFAQLHPGGSLGRRLTAVGEIMRCGDQLRVASESATIREVFVHQSRPGRRTGAVILVDDEGRLRGLFTDSDLARLLEHRRDEQLDRPISDVMTARPTTIAADALLEEAVALLSQKRISELPVIDEEQRPVGLLDITDVIGLLPPA